LKNLLGLGSSPLDIDILFTQEHTRQFVEKGSDRYPLFSDGESVSGKVILRLKPGKKLEYNSIKIEFIGEIGTSPSLLFSQDLT
jgi:vacuolar protein sorting-associated protein 26